jgi:hypothetical protein
MSRIAPLTCRVCGCTNDTACALMLKGRTIGACSWAEYGRRPLCSACAVDGPTLQQKMPGVVPTQLGLPKVKDAPMARWVRHQRAHIAAARQKKERTT